MNTPIIKCPHCGAEYLPVEIYIPEDFLPESDDITKDEHGHIVAYHEGAMNLQEEYTCDYCGHRFTVNADVRFISSVNELHDYNYDYKSPVYEKDRIELSEK